MKKTYQDIISKTPSVTDDIKEKKTRHEFETLQLGKDILSNEIKSGIEQMR